MAGTPSPHPPAQHRAATARRDAAACKKAVQAQPLRHKPYHTMQQVHPSGQAVAGACQAHLHNTLKLDLVVKLLWVCITAVSAHSIFHSCKGVCH
jgi:hypothetical protein